MFTDRVIKWMMGVGMITLVVLLVFSPANTSEGATEAEAEAAQDQLNAWCEEYGLAPGSVVFGGYTDLPDEYNGNENGYILAWCRPAMNMNTYNPECCTIELDIVWQDGRLEWAEKCNLWHEFCHAVCYLEDKVSNGHDGVWEEMRWSKPLYRIGEYIADYSAVPFRLSVTYW